MKRPMERWVLVCVLLLAGCESGEGGGAPQPAPTETPCAATACLPLVEMPLEAPELEGPVQLWLQGTLAFDTCWAEGFLPPDPQEGQRWQGIAYWDRKIGVFSAQTLAGDWLREFTLVVSARVPCSQPQTEPAPDTVARYYVVSYERPVLPDGCHSGCVRGRAYEVQTALPGSW